MPDKRSGGRSGQDGVPRESRDFYENRLTVRLQPRGEAISLLRATLQASGDEVKPDMRCRCLALPQHVVWTEAGAAVYPEHVQGTASAATLTEPNSSAS